MNPLLIAISELVKGQELTIHVDDRGDYIFKIITDFGREADIFWVIRKEAMENIKYHFENGDLDNELANVINDLIETMDVSIIHNEPELR